MSLRTQSAATLALTAVLAVAFPAVFGLSQDRSGAAALPSVLKRTEPDAVRQSPRPAGEEVPREVQFEVDGPAMALTPPAEAVPHVEPPRRSPPAGNPPAARSDRSDAELAATHAPQLSVTAVGPEAITIGREARYAVTLANQSAVDAEAVVVEVRLEGGMEITSSHADVGRVSDAQGLVTWRLDRLPARGQQQLTLTLVARDARPFDLSLSATSRPSPARATIGVLEPKLELVVTGPREVSLGEAALYTFVVTNPGSGDAENVVVHLASAGADSITQELGTLEAGGRIELPVELVAGQSGTIEMRGEATALSSLRAESVHQVTVRAARLAVHVEGPQLQYAGTRASYRVRVANHGDDAANGIALALALPPGLRLVNEPQAADGGLQRRIAQLRPGAEAELVFECELAAAGDQKITARVRSDRGLVAQASYTTRVEAIVDLKLTVNDPSGPVPVGQSTVYELHVVNRGTKAARDVQVLAQFSHGVEPSRAEGADARLVPGQVIFAPIERIEPGEQVTLKVVAKASEAGNHRFRAEVQGDADTHLVAEQNTRFVEVR